MTATEQKLYVFTYLDAEWVPCGQLTLSEDGAKLSASTFAYGLRYLQRPGALEVDPVSLSLRDMDLVRGTALFPPNNRSEEHTSELQSRLHLVCRLLLEKKKKHPDPTPPTPRD